MSADKSHIFAHYWRILGDGTPITPEYNFDAHMGRKHRFDWAFVDDRIGVEVDGGQWAAGGGRHAKDSDREKMNIAAELGWLVFRFSPDMLEKDPTACIEQVKRALVNQR
jgi:very-short-patch-repair endonuclease